MWAWVRELGREPAARIGYHLPIALKAGPGNEEEKENARVPSKSACRSEPPASHWKGKERVKGPPTGPVPHFSHHSHALYPFRFRKWWAMGNAGEVGGNLAWLLAS